MSFNRTGLRACESDRITPFGITRWNLLIELDIKLRLTAGVAEPSLLLQVEYSPLVRNVTGKGASLNFKNPLWSRKVMG